RKLADRDDLGESVDAAYERILHGLSDSTRERQELLEREVLVAKEDHEILEPRLTNRADGLIVERCGEVDPADLGAESARERLDAKRLEPHARTTLALSGYGIIIRN